MDKKAAYRKAKWHLMKCAHRFQELRDRKVCSGPEYERAVKQRDAALAECRRLAGQSLFCDLTERSE